MIKILYVHGYHGNPNGGSFQKLSKYAAEADFGGEQVEMHSIDYDAEHPFESVRALKQYYYENDIDLIIGSSLGGFLAACCDWARRIVVNPCMYPSVELPKIGYAGPVDQYQRMEEHLGYYAEDGDKDLCIACFAEDDEIFGEKYVDDFFTHFEEAYDIPGGHHLSEEGAEIIMKEIAPELIARFKSGEGPGHIVSDGLSDFERMHYAHMMSIYNEGAILKSENCGCFYCRRVFPAYMVEDYSYEPDGRPKTAICPYCMIDSVLADAQWKDLSLEFLEKMNQYWF